MIINPHLKLYCMLFFGATIAGCSQKPIVKADYEIVPIPQTTVANSENPFIITDGTTIVYPENNTKMQNNAEFLASYIKEQTGLNLKTKAGTPQDGAICLTLNLQNNNPEAYKLKSDDKRITIAGVSEAGVFYGIQTLRKSVGIAENSRIEFPAIEIDDAPRFSYRGMHLDIARHFFTINEVKTYIDMLALHNINRFHWHLSDDQGWRIEIKKYPKLTSIGSRRAETVVGMWNSGVYDGTPYGGFYTQEEAKEIVNYAAERYITVIPEIDLPGHMQAAITAYPELGCTGGPYEVWETWGVSDLVLCAGTDSTLQFIKDVLAEIIEIFPSEYIHIGGDECPKTEWEKCPKCQARIKALGLKTDSKHTKEQRLQSFIINTAEQFVNSKGRKIIGWTEIMEGGLSPNATLMSWIGESGGIEAARLHHDVIMTPMDYMYFNFYQAKDTEKEPLAIGGYVPMEKVYNFNPVPDVLNEEEKTYIKGVQANLWTEYIQTFPLIQYMALPRMAALSEVQWCDPSRKNYEDFLNRLPRLTAIYKHLGWTYAKHVLPEEAAAEPDSVRKALR